MPDFDVFSLLEIRKCNRRSHGKRQKGNDKRKICAAQKSGTSLNNLSSKLREHGRHAMLSFLSSLPIPVLRILDIEANRFYVMLHLMLLYFQSSGVVCNLFSFSCPLTPFHLDTSLKVLNGLTFASRCINILTFPSVDLY